MDKNNPEILDYGIYDFANHSWSDLYINFEENLKNLLTRKLPPFKQLETYLIPPYESVIPISIRYPEDERESKIGQLNWETHKLLIRSREGYAVEYFESDRDLSNGLVEQTGLALRRESVTRINQFLKNNSLFLAGLFVPQTLIVNLFTTLRLQRYPILLYKDNDAYNLFVHKTGGFPECGRFIFQAGSGEHFDQPALSKMIDNIAVDRMAQHPAEADRIYIFDKNLSTAEIEFITNELKTEMRIISDELEQIGYSDEFADYFLLSLAHKKIGELYFTV